MIIGLTGKAGSGKDTMADYLVQNYGFIKVSFAGPLKAGLAAMGMPEPKSREDKEKPIEGFNFSWREAAQKLGTEFGRGLDSDIWVKLLLKHIAQHPECGLCHFGCSLENEAALIRQGGYPVVHIRGRQVELGPLAEHASEAGIAEVSRDFVILNEGTLAELYEVIRIMIEEHLT